MVKSWLKRVLFSFAPWRLGVSIFTYVLLVVVTSARADTAIAENSMIATVHPTATEAGLQVLEEGGNAVDAAVAAALTLGGVDGNNSGIGGGCLVLIRLAGGRRGPPHGPGTG